MENGIKKEEKTAISNSTVIVGNISAKEHLIINGRVKGNLEIKGYNLFIGPKGKLEGEVHAQNVRIRGHMRGEIKANGTVEITKEADFSGNIESKGVSVEQGAFFDASVKLGR
ncbi:MAG: polymer-forming cytoskeletal protein [Desulfobacterales bacterium]